MDENENLISDPRKIANIFNDHFATIGSNVQQKILNEVILRTISKTGC